jgi:uncharacterized protein (TIGR02594 family)
MTQKHTILLVHGIRTHASWYERAQQVFAQLEGVEIEPIKYGRFDLFRFLIPGPWRRGPIDRSEDRILPIIDRARKEGGLVSVIAHSNGTNVVAMLLKESHLFKIDNLILCGSVVDSNFDWEGVSHKVSGRIINDYGVRDIWPAVAKSFTWGYGYSGTNGFGAPVKDRLHDTTHSAYFSKDFMEKYWISFFRDGTIVRPEYGDVEIPHSPWWFYFFEVPWKWVIVALLGLLAYFAWSGRMSISDTLKSDDGASTVVAPATATSADDGGPADADASPETPEIPAFILACDRGSFVANPDELTRLRADAELVNTAAWVNIAIGELGQHEFSGDATNPRILAYMSTAEPKFLSDEEPWNSQFVNYVMKRAGKNGTNSGAAKSWLSWGKDAIAEVGDPVVGSIVVASRNGVVWGGVAGFYVGPEGEDSIRMLAGNMCAEVSIVSVPESRILGYRLPADWVGPAQ